MFRIKPVVIALLLMVGLAALMPQKGMANWEKVDPGLLRALETEQVIEFHVILTQQADVSGAAAMNSKAARTAYVYNRLVETANRSQQGILQHLQTEGLSYRAFYIYNAINVQGSRSTLEWLAARPDVARIVPLPDPRPDPVTVDRLVLSSPEVVQWNLLRVGAPEVWEMGFDGTGLVIANNDTGVDYTHPALVNQYRGNLGGGTFDHNYNWWDDAQQDPYLYPFDRDGHGTHTMGTMVGDDGGANQTGVAPGAQWIACASMSLECFEFFLAPWDLTGANPDPSKAPDAINNSWYDPGPFDYQPIIQNLNAAGIAVIKSAGNDGPECSTITNPGGVPEIISTAAFGEGDIIASFSSRGPSDNYGEVILKPEVAAPGVDVYSSLPGGGYGYMSGTSMAAPHTTAMVALLWEAAPCLAGNVPLTKNIMMWTAEPVVDAQCSPFVEHPNDVWGWGILDMPAATMLAIGYCTGMGTLEGTVTDDQAVPIPDATVAMEGIGTIITNTDGNGDYSMDLPINTYTVTASAFGYYPATVNSVEVVLNTTTTQDFALTPLSTYVISGSVTEAGTGLPLLAQVEVLNTPIAPVSTDPVDGSYEIELPGGTYTLRVTSILHLPEERQVVVDADKTENFILPHVPCILLVDDDANSPDVQSYYTAALDILGYNYYVWEVSKDGSPEAADLMGYSMVLWFTGAPYSSTFTAANETAVAAYLDGGGNFFLSSQDYLYEMGVTLFGESYLHIASNQDDVTQASVTGLNVFAGLGPYTLSYPFTDFSDLVRPDREALDAFEGPGGVTGISYDGASFNTVFLGFPLEAVPEAGRAAILDRLVEFFGGCEVVCTPVSITNLTSDSPVLLGETMSFSATASGTEPIAYTWDFGGTGTAGGTGASVTFLYAAVGLYTVTLDVENACPSSDTATLDVEVLAPPVYQIVFLPVMWKTP